MSYSSEHQRMKPVLILARQLDIATNPHPTAIFDAGSAGFQVWCTPDDHPEGWDGIPMDKGAFSKPCQYVGSVGWKWEGEEIVALEISTTAYALADHKPNEYSRHPQPEPDRKTIYNRMADTEWLIEKVEQLFSQAGVFMPPCEIEGD
jgi:hypothetical protein